MLDESPHLEPPRPVGALACAGGACRMRSAERRFRVVHRESSCEDMAPPLSTAIPRVAPSAQGHLLEDRTPDWDISVTAGRGACHPDGDPRTRCHVLVGCPQTRPRRHHTRGRALSPVGGPVSTAQSVAEPMQSVALLLSLAVTVAGVWVHQWQRARSRRRRHRRPRPRPPV